MLPSVPCARRLATGAQLARPLRIVRTALSGQTYPDAVGHDSARSILATPGWGQRSGSAARSFAAREAPWTTRSTRAATVADHQRIVWDKRLD